MHVADLRDRIVDTALKLANESSWEHLRLSDIATDLGVTLDELRAHFREKEEIVDAWFDRADAAMLRDAAQPEYSQLPTRERLARAIVTWLGALSNYQRVTRQMVANRLEPGHLHYQVAGAMRVSRTVQWIREAAGIRDALPWRAISETATTTIYLATFVSWMVDTSAEFASTRARLDRLLRQAERTMAWIPRTCRPDSAAAPSRESVHE